MQEKSDACGRCGGKMQLIGGLPFCTHCNDREGEHYNYLSSSINEFSEQSDQVLIICPGATLYHPGTNKVAAGVRFFDHEDPSKGYEIISRPVFSPNHVRHRWVKTEHAHLIRRCRSCQDYTIRMKRKEGPNLYIPPRNRRESNQRRRG
jgi:hypothetical protein